MRHLTGYNESADQPWWRVDEDGLKRHMSGQVVDCFSGGEVKAILDVVGGVVPGGDLALVDLASIEKATTALNGRNPGTSEMGIDSFDVEYARIEAHIFRDRTQSSSTKYLGIPPDRIWINVGRDHGGRVDCLILKSVDDYFYVRKNHVGKSAWPWPPDSDYYICDGIAGLMSLLPLVLPDRKDI